MRPTAGRGGLVATSAVAVGVMLALWAPSSREGSARLACGAALIPAYVPPDALMALARHVGPGDIVVINPHNGPGAVGDAAYRRAVAALQDVGADVLGYVSTGYGARPMAQVVDDARRHGQWFAVDGIFLDEVPSAAAGLARYARLAARVRSAAGPLVVLNPGVVPDRGYFAIADVVVTYEGPAAGHAAAVARMPAWLAEIPRARVAHLVYDAGADDVATSAGTSAGLGYATPGRLPNPWGTVPDDLRAPACA